MRALLVNPKFAKSFWTFEESLDILGKKQLVAPLGLITVAALLPSEWELKLLDRNFQQVDSYLWQWADVLMISAMVAQRDDAQSLIRLAKEKGKPVVVGGPYASSFPEELLEMGADCIFVGEAETGLEGLVEAIDSGKAGVVFQRHEKPDLTASPIPRFELLDMQAYACMSVQTARGCPHRCEFCDVVSLYGRAPRHKSAVQVVAELDRLYELGWSDTVFVCDDNFVGNRTHAKEILELLIPWNTSHGQPFGFWTQATALLGRDLELIDLMTAANFGQVFVGIETPEEETLLGIKKRHNVTNPLAESLRSINENGLSIIGSFILGFDGEKKGAGDRICDFIDQVHLPQVMLNLLQAPPNTAMWDRLERENRLIKSVRHGESIGGGFNFITDRAETEILEEYVRAVEYLYEPSRYLKRAYEYYLAMRPTRRAQAEKRGEQYQGPVCKPEFERPQVRKPSRFAGAVKMLWRHGVVAPWRFQFWRQLIGMYRSNPSRLTGYMLSIGFGENLFSLREVVRQRVEEYKREHGTGDDPRGRPEQVRNQRSVAL